MEKIIEELRGLRISEGLSICELAKKMNTPRARISEIEHGRGGLTLMRMLDWADALGYDTKVSFTKK